MLDETEHYRNVLIEIGRSAIAKAVCQSRPDQRCGEERQQEKKNMESEPAHRDCRPGKRQHAQAFGGGRWNHKTYCSVCSSLPGLNRTAFPGGMATSAPVRGLRPIPVLRGRTLKIPKPRSSIRSPCASARFILSKTVSTAISALVLVIPVRFTTSLMMSSLIKTASFDVQARGDLLPASFNHMIRLDLISCQAMDRRRDPRPSPPRNSAMPADDLLLGLQ